MIIKQKCGLMNKYDLSTFKQMLLRGILSYYSDVDVQDISNTTLILS